MRVKERYAGKRVKCPKCGKGVRIPNPEPALAIASESGVNTHVPRGRPVGRKKSTGRTKRTPTRGRRAPTSRSRRPADSDSGERRPRRSTGRRRRPTSSGSKGGGILSGVVAKLVGAGIVILFVIIGGAVSGSATYNANFAQVHPGMTKAQVIDIMGSPDVTEPTDTGEMLGFEAIDQTGRSTARHTFYFVWIDSGVVSEKRRMNEEEFKRLTGASW